ncbi:DUF2993 domain-containing protein [Nonomuraea longicatena]|uniref:DUF2993 domain-containing protein n=1 Tax=Nonomuraea longicatena TaxID=83682 RepID=A0ABN1QTI5_9ACTN
MRKLIVFLIVLIVLLIAVDRVAVAGVERDLGNRIAAAADVEGTPTVTIEGIPFLTQALSGSYPEVRFDLGTVRYGKVQVSELRGAAYDVTAPLADVIQNTADIRAGRLAVTGVIDNATLARFAPSGIKVSARNGKLAAAGTVAVAGRQVQFRADLRFEAADGGIRVTADKIEGVPQALAGFAGFTVPIKGRLPFDVKVTDVRSVAGGLEISAEGKNVPLRG